MVVLVAAGRIVSLYELYTLDMIIRMGMDTKLLERPAEPVCIASGRSPVTNSIN